VVKAELEPDHGSLWSSGHLVSDYGRSGWVSGQIFLCADCRSDAVTAVTRLLAESQTDLL